MVGATMGNFQFTCWLGGGTLTQDSDLIDSGYPHALLSSWAVHRGLWSCPSLCQANGCVTCQPHYRDWFLWDLEAE